MKFEKITIGILNHDNNVYEKYVAKSLIKLKGDFDLIIEQNKKPAQAYNDIIGNYILLFYSYNHYTTKGILVKCKEVAESTNRCEWWLRKDYVIAKEH